MKSREFVIAKYHRPTEWTKLLNGKVTIYNKSKDTLQPNEIYLQNNVGRCIHTYVTHILNNYDNLADETFFSQDSPFEHVSDYINVVNNMNNVDGFVCLTSYIQQESNMIVGPNGGIDLQIPDFWNFLFISPCQNVCNFCIATHFAVDKNTILMRTKNFYQKILYILETRYESPWEMERILPYWFNSQIIERKFIKY
jgi:hypothetical protein